MSDNMRSYPVAIAQVGKIWKGYLPDFGSSFRAKSFEEALAKAKRLLEADITIADGEYPEPSSLHEAEKNTKENAGLESFTLYNIVIDLNMCDFSRRFSLVERKCKIPLWLDLKLEELSADRSELLIKAAKEFVHQKEKERSIKNLTGKSVMVETKQDTLYGYIDSYDIDIKDEAEEAFIKLRLFENLTEKVFLKQIEEIEEIDLIYDETGYYHPFEVNGHYMLEGRINWCGNRCDALVNHPIAYPGDFTEAFSILHVLCSKAEEWDLKMQNAIDFKINSILKIVATSKRPFVSAYVIPVFVDIYSNGSFYFEFQIINIDKNLRAGVSADIDGTIKNVTIEQFDPE